jgi:hypothetical protein
MSDLQSLPICLNCGQAMSGLVLDYRADDIQTTYYCLACDEPQREQPRRRALTVHFDDPDSCSYEEAVSW